MQRRNVAAPARADFFVRKDLGFRAFVIVYLCAYVWGWGEGGEGEGAARARAPLSPPPKSRGTATERCSLPQAA